MTNLPKPKGQNKDWEDICIRGADQMETIFLGDSLSGSEDFRKAKKVIRQLLADSKRKWVEEIKKWARDKNNLGWNVEGDTVIRQDDLLTFLSEEEKK